VLFALAACNDVQCQLCVGLEQPFAGVALVLFWLCGVHQLLALSMKATQSFSVVNVR
jgi:hypothetical protein